GENILIYKVNIINASSKKDVFFYESPTSTHNDIMGGGGMSYTYEYDVKYNICHLRKKSRMR
ncbi:TPA: RHS element protein dsORF-f3, partial [Escherichia coli]